MRGVWHIRGRVAAHLYQYCGQGTAGLFTGGRAMDEGAKMGGHGLTQGPPLGRGARTREGVGELVYGRGGGVAVSL